MSTFETLQREVGAWSEENFGDQPAVNPLLGIGEELGELVAHLESDDDREDVVSRDDLEDVAGHDVPGEHERDCVGDVLVYLVDFCHRRGVDAQRAFADGRSGDAAVEGLESGASHDGPLYGVVAALGRLNRSVLKRRQGIRLDDPRVGHEAERRAIASLLGHLDDFARDRGYTLEECVQVAWYDEVTDREWDSSYAEDVDDR